MESGSLESNLHQASLAAVKLQYAWWEKNPTLGVSTTPLLQVQFSASQTVCI